MRFTIRSRLSRSFVALGRVDIVSFESGPVMRRKAVGRWSLVVRELWSTDFSFASDQRLTTVLLATRCCFRHSPFFDSLLKPLPLKNSFHKHAGRMHHIRIQ